MIDFHSHILPNTDDGSTSIEETINIIKEAKQAGFTQIISTSHYIQGYYEYDENERMQLLEKIKKWGQTPADNTNELNGPELYLGSEIYITAEMPELLKEKKASTINNSKYVLFELPLNTESLIAKEVVYRLIENGYVPIIAHPERSSYVKESPEYVKELAEMGTLFQANYGSIIGMYGTKAQKTVKKLLKEDLIQFLGSDVHRTNQIYPKIPKVMKKLKKILSEEKLEVLTTTNAQKVLNNQDIVN